MLNEKPALKLECTIAYCLKETQMTSHLFLEKLDFSMSIVFFKHSNVNIYNLPLLESKD